MIREYDCIIIGAGIYGLYAASLLSKKKYRIAVLEYEEKPFRRASYVNQARVHNGYHYPRSYSTARKSSSYFDRFNKDFSFAINSFYKKIYAISSRHSYTNGNQFQRFCKDSGVPCQEINKKLFFKENHVEAAFETREYSFCAKRICDYLVKGIDDLKRVEWFYGFRLKKVEREGGSFVIIDDAGKKIKSDFIINATYAGVNQIIDAFCFKKFKIKYEICEIILCDTNSILQDVGVTVMDGPFFSVMPFGFDCHSLTSVAFTPHITSYNKLPLFPCQESNPDCSETRLGNCNSCPVRPTSAWPYMSQLARKYLRDDATFEYVDSLFAIKPILMASEIDDSRPTIIKYFSHQPSFVSIFSGKINTIYDLDSVLSEAGMV